MKNGIQITNTGARMITVVAGYRRRRNEEMPRLVKTPVRFANGELGQYTCCTLCYKPIDQTWDHWEECKYFKEEAVTKFLKEGLK